MAEVLITLGIIGIVSALTLPSIITNIQNRGYVEALKKNYSVIQQATNKIMEEQGPPVTWTTWTTHISEDNSGNEYILGLYKYHLKFSCSSTDVPWQYLCPGVKKPDYKTLNGKQATHLGYYEVFVNSKVFILYDGTILGLTFRNKKGSVLWGTPLLTFTVDVNGLKGPNQLGRDVFFLYLDSNTGKVLPYTNENFNKKDTCEKGKEGYSCAYRVITEGKMNY